MDKYTILKGCHYSNFIPNFHKITSSMVFQNTFIFDKSCVYEIDEPSCVNKLFGFCFGFGVHKNSIRFGWTYNKELNCIWVFGYFYKSGKLCKTKIFSCNLDEEHTYKIELNRISSVLGNYTFRFLIDGKEVTDFQEIQSNSCFITTLGPYFGGNTRAPHKMKIIKK